MLNNDCNDIVFEELWYKIDANIMLFSNKLIIHPYYFHI